MISPNQCARAPISLDSVEMIDSHLPCYLPPDAVSAVNHTMPYDMLGGEHRGESRLYCPRAEVKCSEMTSGTLATQVKKGKFEFRPRAI